MKVTFDSQLALTNDPNDDGDWVLLQPFICTINGWKITIPTGFRTDLASTPRYLWSVMPPFGRWDEAAVMHDFLYQHGLFEDRKLADDAFYEGMIVCGVPRWRAYSMWVGVRCFGGKYYESNRLES